MKGIGGNGKNWQSWRNWIMRGNGQVINIRLGRERTREESQQRKGRRATKVMGSGKKLEMLHR